MATIISCSIGYAPLVFTTGSTIKGCISCGGFLTDVNSNEAATGYKSCKLPTLADAAALTALVTVNGATDLTAF